jgi:acetylornithine deacetylase/succinyl-diaminopimelate desuccinylase-like protein
MHALQFALEQRQRVLDDLKQILSIASISTEGGENQSLNDAAKWVAAKLTAIGMHQVEIFPTGKHPIVYGERLGVQNAPTILIYGHYDVQPVDPLDLWESDPFTPTVRGEDIYARGSSDMKGQMLVTMMAVEALVQTGGLPLNVKWLLEGEEEIGSPSLAKFITEKKDLLACDFAINPDSGMMGRDLPTITYALRGLAYFELRLTGPTRDLHSGIYGGAVLNPANALAKLIAGMHDDLGRVTLPGFYDSVRALSQEERQELARLPIKDSHLIEQTGVPALYGEDGYTGNERASARPTLDVNGILSGFTGEGSKTVIPSWAMAKISTRLVPDQDPQEVHQQLIQYLDKNVPAQIRWELKMMSGAPASISDRSNRAVQAMSKALETVWAMRPFFKREGGSIPVVGEMQKLLGAESVIVGFGLPDDNVHAPNEKLHLPTWYRGIDTYIHFLCNLAGL